MGHRFALCICTYKRPRLLEQLLLDAARQSLQPAVLVVVDGDPSSGDVRRMLEGTDWPHTWRITYVPSNHGNQTYQRYLAWRIVRQYELPTMLYLDDDLRIEQMDSFANILAPLLGEQSRTVAVTGTLEFGNGRAAGMDGAVTLDHLRTASHNVLVARFGGARGLAPGSLSASGHRVPISFRGNSYEKVQWLRGGAIALRSAALSEAVLDDDLFAMNHRRMGLCEDLVISRRLLQSGDLMLAFNATFRHPNEDAPKAYSSKSYDLGYATAYSRRWLNDNFRGFEAPRLNDRIALLRSYLATAIRQWWRAASSMNRQRFLFALGYSKGIVRALVQVPSAQSLTPEIDWWADAEQAVATVMVVREPIA